MADSQDAQSQDFRSRDSTRNSTEAFNNRSRSPLEVNIEQSLEEKFLRSSSDETAIPIGVHQDPGGFESVRPTNPCLIITSS